MCAGNCRAQDMLLCPQIQTPSWSSPPKASWMEAHTLFFVGLPERGRGQGKVDATYSRLDRSEDFLFLFRLFRCTFMTLWRRTLWFGWCCMCQDPERNTEQNTLSRELKYMFSYFTLEWGREVRRLSGTAWQQDRSFTGSLLHCPWRTIQKPS